MSNTPGPPPEGGDVDRAASLLTMYCCECVIAFGFIVFRTWARFSIRGLGTDDVCMYITWALFLALTIIVAFLTLNGGTRHKYYLEQNPQKALYVVRLNYVAQPHGIMAVGMGKISVAFTILRIMGVTSFWRKWCLWLAIGLTFIISVVAAVFTFTQCEDPAALWTPSLVATTRCWDPQVQSNFSIFSSSWNAFVDVTLAVLPISIIYPLKITTSKKAGLCVLLGLGIFAAICAAVKTSKLVALAARSDLTWATYDLYAWVSAEIFLLIICGSVPALKPFYNRYKAKRRNRGSSYLSSKRAPYNNSPSNHPYVIQPASQPCERTGKLDDTLGTTRNAIAGSSRDVQKSDYSMEYPNSANNHSKTIQVSRTIGVNSHDEYA